jgi:hypothetical protein
MKNNIPVIDLFAGRGGLNHGFSAYRSSIPQRPQYNHKTLPACKVDIHALWTNINLLGQRLLHIAQSQPHLHCLR